jgi:arsenate reductase
MYQVYGIPNCNTVKKALDWLSQHNIPFTFHNFKKEGIEATTLKNWCQQAGGWQNLLNKQGTTWRKLDADTQQSITTEAKAIQLMQQMVSIIKRPVIVKGTTVVAIGFNEALYNTVFK